MGGQLDFLQLVSCLGLDITMTFARMCARVRCYNARGSITTSNTPRLHSNARKGRNTSTAGQKISEIDNNHVRQEPAVDLVSQNIEESNM